MVIFTQTTWNEIPIFVTEFLIAQVPPILSVERQPIPYGLAN
jgi:hypothetical protein